MVHPDRLFQKVAPGVFEIVTPSGNGTGFLAREDGLILTNAHVVGTEPVVTVRNSDGITTSCAVVRSNRRRDLAVVHHASIAGTDGCRPLEVADDGRELQPGLAVFTIGCPASCSPFSFTAGYVSAVRFEPAPGEVPFVQFNLSVNWGNSGGPVFLESGKVAAVISQLRFTGDGRRIEGMALGIPGADVRGFLDSIPDLSDDVSGFRYCTVCGRSVGEGVYCSHCGSPLERRSGERDPLISVECPVCCHADPGTGPYCTRCGSPLGNSPERS